MAILILLLIFGVIVTIHEFGHFIAAKKSGVFVEEFAIGMGPKLWGLERNGTLYSIRLILIGGYCKMKDEDSKSTDVDSFGNATKLKKFIILFAGAFMNFLLAIFIFVGISFFTGMGTTKVAAVVDNMPAAQAGIIPGDEIYCINGKRIHIFSEITFYLDKYRDRPLDIVVKRNGEKISFKVTPILQDETYLVGITSNLKTPLIGKAIQGYERANLFETIYDGFWNMIFTINSTISGLIDIITGNVSLDAVKGPIGIAPIVSETYDVVSENGLLSIILTMLNLTALLSTSIGIMNLLPLPALDGGRILFLAIEAISGKPIPEEKEGMIHFVGFIVLLAFGTFIAFKDLADIFMG